MSANKKQNPDRQATRASAAAQTPKLPPVYRPQPAPKVLQRKTNAPANAQTARAPAAPPVYRPELKGAAQPKTASAAKARAAQKATPVNRPQTKPAVQTPARPAQMKPRHAAPHAHQCRPACKAVQPKIPSGSGVATAQGRGLKAAAGRTNPPTAPDKPHVRPGQLSLRGRPAVVQRRIWLHVGDRLQSLGSDNRTLNLDQGPFGLEEGETWDDATGDIERLGAFKEFLEAPDKVEYGKRTGLQEATTAARTVGEKLRTNNVLSIDEKAARLFQEAENISKRLFHQLEQKEQFWKRERDPKLNEDDRKKWKASLSKSLLGEVKKALVNANNDARDAMATLYGRVIAEQPMNEGNNRFTYILMVMLSTYLRAPLPPQEHMARRPKTEFKPTMIKLQFLGMYGRAVVPNGRRRARGRPNLFANENSNNNNTTARYNDNTNDGNKFAK